MQMSDQWKNIQILQAAITTFDKCFSVSLWRGKYCKYSRLNIKVLEVTASVPDLTHPLQDLRRTQLPFAPRGRLSLHLLLQLQDAGEVTSGVDEGHSGFCLRKSVKCSAAVYLFIHSLASHHPLCVLNWSLLECFGKTLSY